MSLMTSAFKADSWPPAVYSSDKTATLHPCDAYWLCDHTIAVWALRSGRAVRVVSVFHVGVSINGKAPVWVGAGCGVEIMLSTAPPWTLSTVSVSLCAPVMVHRQNYADALLTVPGCNLAIAKTAGAAEWSDAVIIDNKAKFVCGGCLQQFPTLEHINRHFQVKLTAPEYVSMLPETKFDAAARYTPDVTNARF